MSRKPNVQSDSLYARLLSWIERQYGHCAASAGESDEYAGTNVAYLRPRTDPQGTLKDFVDFTWKKMPSHEHELPTAIGIRPLRGHPACYELVEALRGGRNRHTYWSFDTRVGWRIILDV